MLDLYSKSVWVKWYLKILELNDTQEIKKILKGHLGILYFFKCPAIVRSHHCILKYECFLKTIFNDFWKILERSGYGKKTVLDGTH